MHPLLHPSTSLRRPGPGNVHKRWRVSRLFCTCAILGIVFLGGCATTPTEEPESRTRDYVFFPAPPAEPRFQHLLSFSEERDIVGESENKFATFVLGEAPPQKPILKPYGISLHDGKIYVCDTVGGLLEEVDLRENKIRYIRPSGLGTLRKPINIFIEGDGTRYVADTVLGQVKIYSKTEEYLGAIGSKDEMKPTDVVAGPDRLYVADLANNNVRVFDKATRDELYTLPREGDDEKAALFLPTNLALDAEGRLYVSDAGAFHVQKYDPDGRYLSTIGSHGNALGQFGRPKGIAVDRSNRLYVVDAALQVIQVFDEDGKLLLFFGEPNKSTVSFVLPAQVIVDYDHIDYFRQFAAPGFQIENLVLVTNQYGARKVNVFGFGHMK